MKPATPNNPRTASEWLHILEAAGSELQSALEATYGPDTQLQTERCALICEVLRGFMGRFGDCPVRIHRAPGRINLRGMHVDTHGGWLNLATHQREVVCVSAATDQGELRAANLDPRHAEVTCPISTTDAPRQNGWAGYVQGVARRWADRDDREASPGIRCMVGSDLPIGASLSSSAALCIVLLDALGARSGVVPDAAARILAARDAEWYAGARTGTGDQAAIVLGRAGMITHATLLAEDFALDHVSHIPIPSDAAILVIDSLTSRQLSGDARADYARNRFAYSMALHILREELRLSGWKARDVDHIDRLSRATVSGLGGDGAVYALLRRVPESLSLDEIRDRYAPPDLSAAYDQYFGDLSASARPIAFALRGPLLFALAESERARSLPDVLASGVEAGALLRAGHDGDRVVADDGTPFQRAVSDECLAQWQRENRPLATCPGDYGASTPALDFLVDAAHEAGAWGASLTGAGMGGAVVALCAREKTDAIAAKIREKMQSEPYAERSGITLSEDDPRLKNAVMLNTAIAGAGELRPPS